MSFQSIDDIEDALRSTELTVRDLYTAYAQRQPVINSKSRKAAGHTTATVRQIPWLQDDLSLAVRFTRRALDKEEFLLVCDVARETLWHWTDADDKDRTDLVRVRMNYASALTRLGFTRDARGELEPLVRDDFRPELGRKLKGDIFFQLGNILREESHHATARAEKLRSAKEALDFYERALELETSRLDVLSVAAGASLILSEPGSGLRNQAYERARQILSLTEARIDVDGPRKETTRARATAFAVLGDIAAASAAYAELPRIEGVTTADLADTRYYAQYLAEALGKPRDFFKRAFPPLQLVVFAGHLPDRPGGPSRFGPELIEPMRAQIRERLDELNVRVGLASASAGADLLFVEALLDRGGSVHLVLPWSQEEFRQTSVRNFEPAGSAPIWEPLFDRALREATTVREMGQPYAPTSDVGWEYMLEVSVGLALQTSRVSRLDLQPIALWDGHPGLGMGGTASFARFWRHQLQQNINWIELPSPPKPLGEDIGGRRSRRCERATMHQEVKSMLFADIVGYSKLTEHAIQEFAGTFLDRVSHLAASSRYAPRTVNTWGDAFHAIFDFAGEAGRFALELVQMIKESENDWLEKGLYWEEFDENGAQSVKHPLSIRIGLHTGPVFIHYDPVVRRLGFTGTHVNRAARIEPIASPGEVFASEEFAAMAELGAEIERRNAGEGGERGEIEDNGGNSGFVCEYAGSMQLAKDYPGRYRIYRVVPKRIFALEELAKAAHEEYCSDARARGQVPEINNSLRPWGQLTEDLREANRAQVADIPNKLRLLGYELASSHGIRPVEMIITDAKFEELSIREHDRWMSERRRQGWTYGSRRDNIRKYHPSLVPWDQLSEVEKDKDRSTVRNISQLVERAGFCLRKLV